MPLKPGYYKVKPKNKAIMDRMFSEVHTKVGKKKAKSAAKTYGKR